MDLLMAVCGTVPWHYGSLWIKGGKKSLLW